MQTSRPPGPEDELGTHPHPQPWEGIWFCPHQRADSGLRATFPNVPGWLGCAVVLGQHRYLSQQLKREQPGKGPAGRTKRTPRAPAG